MCDMPTYCKVMTRKYWRLIQGYTRFMQADEIEAVVGGVTRPENVVHLGCWVACHRQ